MYAIRSYYGLGWNCSAPLKAFAFRIENFYEPKVPHGVAGLMHQLLQLYPLLVLSKARRGLDKPIGSLTQMGTIRLGKRTEKRSPLISKFVPLASLKDLVS